MKKRIIALALSAIMLLGETLPVKAENDITAVSENETERDVFADGEEVTAEECIDTSVIAEDGAADAICDDESEIIIDEEEAEEAEAAVSGENVLCFADESVRQSITCDEFETIQTEAAYATTSGTVNAGSIDIDGKLYMLNATVEYQPAIAYRAKKINAENDLHANVSSSSLYGLAKDLSATGSVTKEIITWKCIAKKNKNATDDSHFILKAKVAKTSVAKAQGISGKSLSKLKKAVKAFNKAAKIRSNAISFRITPINAAEMYYSNPPTMWPVVVYRWGIIFVKFSHFRARLNPEKQPVFSTTMNYKKWSKISNKEFTISKSGSTYTFTPNNKNVTGPSFVIKF